ncbi:hypothetical protein BHE74_00036876 [Ensete ventricosum]|nr:hypothetical protein BHE74_00036876 [Ensete ventricosum]
MLQSSTSKPLFTTSGALASFLYSLSNDSFYNRLSATTLLFCWLSHSSAEVSLCMRPSSLCTTTVASAPMSSGTFPTPSTADDGFYIYSSTRAFLHCLLPLLPKYRREHLLPSLPAAPSAAAQLSLPPAVPTAIASFPAATPTTITLCFLFLAGPRCSRIPLLPSSTNSAPICF